MRPGCNVASVPNCSAITSGEWFGSITPPAPRRMVSVCAATCAMSTLVADEAIAAAGDPRVRIVPGGIEIGVAAPFAGVVVGRFEVSIDGEELLVVPSGGGLGVVPIGAGPLSAGLEILAGAVDGIDHDPASGGLRLRREIPLADGRTVRLDDLELVTGELAVRFRTLGP